MKTRVDFLEEDIKVSMALKAKYFQYESRHKKNESQY